MIDKVLQRANTLDGKPSELEGRILATQRVNSHLQNMIDRQEQNSRRLCLVVNDMTEPNEADNRDVDNIAATLDKETGIDTILNNIDKAHPIGRVENSRKLRIVKFRSDHFKEVIYKKHKQRKKTMLPNAIRYPSTCSHP